MYLLVIVTLIIGVLSLYAQILSLQAARFADSQTGLANTMLQWHSAAVTLGADIADNNLYPGGPCSLTFSAYPLSGLNACPTPAVLPKVASAGTVTGPGSSYAATTIANNSILPPGYTTTAYQFYSVLYQPPTSNSYYVVTYIQPPTLGASNPAPGYLTMQPNNNLISLTSDDLLHQLSLSGIPDYAYGTQSTTVTVNGTPYPALLSPSTQTGKTNFTYVFPTSLGMKTGAIAIVSSTAGY